MKIVALFSQGKEPRRRVIEGEVLPHPIEVVLRLMALARAKQNGDVLTLAMAEVRALKEIAIKVFASSNATRIP
jgi:hypothetical protein